MAKKKIKLIPPDRKKCQVRKYNPWMLGGSVYSRCANKPDYIVYGEAPDTDGQKGSQSVCKSCRKEWEKRTGIKGVDKSWKWKSLAKASDEVV